MSSSENKMEPVVSVRLVSADYYMTSPTPGLDIGYSTYRGLEIKKVPVIRVFGSTSTGYKVCLHIHGVFPYFYIPYDGSAPPDKLGHQIVIALDKAINILQGQGMSLSHHVFKAVLVSGIPMYGYHSKEHQLFKVYFYNPITRKHSYDLLLNGAVLKKNLQPCEAHIPFILQFLMDFNLQGMNFIHLKKALARRKPNDAMNMEHSKAEPVSTCEMELDCSAGDILNSLDVQDGVQMNPGLAALWEEEIERRKIKNINVDSINPPISQPRLNVVATSSHTFYLNNLIKKLRDCVAESGDVSLSFCEVNEQLETTLAIETPEGLERTLLSASSIDFHAPRHQLKPLESEESNEVLDILCDLADEHGSFIGTPSAATKSNAEDKLSASEYSNSSRLTVTTPLLDTVSSCDSVEDLPFDDDSVLGTQHSKANSCDNLANIVSNDPTSDSDEDRETLEMSQIFDESDLVPDFKEYRNNLFSSTSLGQINEEEEEENSSSSFTEAYLPNVDGADDSSDDEPKQSGKTKNARKYKPLQFRPASNVQVKTGTSLNLQSPSPSPHSVRLNNSVLHERKMPKVNNSVDHNSRLECSEALLDSGPTSTQRLETESMKQPKPHSSEYTDALYTMSYLSPLPFESPKSPPQPGTPIKDVRITMRPLLQDISAYESSSGCKIKVNSGRIILKSMEEEIAEYQTQSRVRLNVVSSISDRKSPVSQESCRKRPHRESNSDHVTEHAFEVDVSRIQEENQDDTVSSLSERKKLDCDKSQIPISIKEVRDNFLKSQTQKSCNENKEADGTTQGSGKQTTEEEETKDAQVYDTNSIIGSQENEICMIDAETSKNDEDDMHETNAHLNVSLFQVRSKEGSASSSFIPELHDSIHSPNQNPSRSSSSLELTSHCDSFNSGWIESSSSFFDDSVGHVEENKTCSPFSAKTSQSIVVQPQVFNPSTIYATIIDGPSRKCVVSTLDLYNIPSADNGAPFWSDAKDLDPAKMKDLHRQTLPIGSKLISHLPDFGASNQQQIGQEMPTDASRNIVITPLAIPPSRKSVTEWLERLKEQKTLESDLNMTSVKPMKKPEKSTSNKQDRSQIEAPSMNNSFGFRVSFGNCLEAKAVHQNQYLTILSLELHVETRQKLRPDPEFDAVVALFYTISNDVPIESPIPDILTGVIVIDSDAELNCNSKQFFNRAGVVGVDIVSVQSEVDLFRQIVKLVSTWNPDILVGYEIEMLSLGYLLQRGTVLGIPLHNLLSRIPESVPGRNPTFPEDIIEGGYMVEKNSDINIPGRIVLNLWRILKVEIALQSYTFENMAFHILRRRVSTYTFEKLTSWWKSNHDRWQVVEHYLCRVRGNVDLMEQLDVIGRTSELARLFGIQFYEVFTRGSQYRVESMMLRLAKPKNFIAASPSVTQRSRMKAPEWLPLILEPESKFYTDPVLVLDFQSLYPSMIIAYNYCYSTCVGRTNLLGKNEPFEFGCTQLLIPPAVIQRLIKHDLVNISPAGVVFVKPEIRKGILPQMLDEILNTRIMVKQSMKEYEGDTTLRRVFDSRQLGLKLIANVTYGYTSANFSGRMPCVEIGDSVVSKGRETLERAIHLIENRPEWKARVVYGDTDSVFVLLPGRNRQEAFEIGDQIADAVTKTNPQPVKLKFEKVYHPCILQTKKRYVGYKYESVKQKNPVYEAKGIETVRRDGCPAVVKLLERSLRLLFDSSDVSKVKAYVQRQFSKILQNRSSLQDFIFAKEFRGRQGYKPGACVPALEIAKTQSRIDRRSEPRIGERVPYIVVYGSPGVPLIRLVVPAEQLLIDTSLRLNGHYYITRAIIPALQRCLGLLGADVFSWYQSLPRINAVQPSSVGHNEHGNTRKATISQYFGSSVCLLCDEPIFTNGLCAACGASRQTSSFSLAAMQRLREKDYAELISLCRSCTGNVRVEQDCVSMDCPVLYRRVKAYQSLQLVSKWHEALSLL